MSGPSIEFTSWSGAMVHVTGYVGDEDVALRTACGVRIPDEGWVWEAEDKPYDVAQCGRCLKIVWPGARERLTTVNVEIGKRHPAFEGRPSSPDDPVESLDDE